MVVHTSSAEQTRALGRRLGALLAAGDIVALSGDLGAGKTVFTQGIAEGAGATGYVASPTFTFVREYRGPETIYHIDLYRLEEPRQLEDLGLEELIEGHAIVVIEWAEKAVPLLPPEHLWVAISFVNGDEWRQITLVPRGTRFDEIAKTLTAG